MKTTPEQRALKKAEREQRRAEREAYRARQRLLKLQALAAVVAMVGR